MTLIPVQMEWTNEQSEIYQSLARDVASSEKAINELLQINRTMIQEKSPVNHGTWHWLLTKRVIRKCT